MSVVAKVLDLAGHRWHAKLRPDDLHDIDSVDEVPAPIAAKSLDEK
jgi:hypothetical protein